MPTNKRTSGRSPVEHPVALDQPNAEQPQETVAAPPAPPVPRGQPSGPAQGAPEEGRRGRGLNINDLKDKSIQQ
ncbi:MAG: hypothetical protein M3545_14510, partial [Acidobacteriota bacterium]|nr:hypothetical protein [Acidobacteriota bacterium]